VDRQLSLPNGEFIMSISLGIDGTPLIGQRTGVGNYTARLLSALLDVNQEWEYRLYSNRALRHLELHSSRLVQPSAYFPLSRWLWMQTILSLAIRRDCPDLCHFTNALAPLWLPGPFVLTIHDASLLLYPQYHPRARLLTIRLLLPVVARRASAIIAVSNHARSELIRVLDLPPGKVHVVYEAAPDTYMPVTAPAQLGAVRNRYRLPERYLLYVGTLEPRKNLSCLVRAFGQIRRRWQDHHLIIAGASGWLMENFEREIEQLDLKQSVHLLGYVPDDDLPGLFSMATAFVFPSLYEGFGLPPLEAMACGTPVLTSNTSSLAEICADAAQLVDPQDEASLVAGLEKLLSDAAWRQELAWRGLRRAQAFSWEGAARETTAVYCRVLRPRQKIIREIHPIGG
jgi:glycosyltransferase involved in cell wall biosynthesis